MKKMRFWIIKKMKTKKKLNKKGQTEFEKEFNINCEREQDLIDLEFLEGYYYKEKKQHNIYKDERYKKTIINDFLNRLFKTTIIFGFPLLLLLLYCPKLILYFLLIFLVIITYKRIKK